jgi:hypothetical protein
LPTGIGRPRAHERDTGQCDLATEPYGAIDCFVRGIDAGVVFQLGGKEDAPPRYAGLNAEVEDRLSAFAFVLVLVPLSRIQVVST